MQKSTAIITLTKAKPKANLYANYSSKDRSNDFTGRHMTYAINPM